MTTVRTVARPQGRQPSPRPIWQKNAAVAVTAAVVVFLVAWYQVKNNQAVDKPLWMADIKIYLGAAHQQLQGGDPWALNAQGWSYLYPPPTPWLFAPLTKLSMNTVGLLYTTLNVTLLGYVVWAVLRRVMPGSPRRVLLTAVALIPVCSWFGPVADSLLLGNVDLLIMALVIADFVELRTTKAHGLLIGIATVLKFQSGLFVLFMLLDRRLRPALTATVTFLVVNLATLAAQPSQSRHYWSTVFPHLSERMGGLPQAIYSNSFLSTLVRVTHDETVARFLWIPLCGVVLVAAAVVMHRASRRDDEILAVVVCGLVSVTITSLSWVHYWVWIVPLAVFLLVRSVQRGSAPLACATLGLLAVFHARTYRFADITPMGMEGWLHDLSLVQQLETSMYALGTLAVIPVCLYYLRAVVPREEAAPAIQEKPTLLAAPRAGS
ncbi:glycosyltransferase family 87 protein [Streptomyces phaeochromogenes]